MIQTLFGSTEQKAGFLERMKEAVSRTRENLSDRIEEVVAFAKEIDRSTLDDLEATLIGADLGTTTTHEVLEKLREKADRKQIRNVDELKRLLKEELLAILEQGNVQPVQRVDGMPEVIVVVGVNGTGKTTTIGKLAQVFRSDGKNVLLCAADTFRAAAIEQLEIWGQRTGTEVIKTKSGGPGGRPVRRPAGRHRSPHRLRHCGYGRTAAHQDQLDGGTGKDAAHGATHRSRRAARDPARDGCHDGTERIAASAAVYAIGGRDRHCSYKIGRDSQGRGGGRDHTGTRRSRALCRSWRESRRPAAIQPQGIRGFVVRIGPR